MRGNASLFFPKIKHDKNLIVVPLKTISDKGMCEVVYFFNTISSKHFILSASLVFKPYNTVAQYEKQLQEGRQFFEDLGKAVLVD